MVATTGQSFSMGSYEKILKKIFSSETIPSNKYSFIFPLDFMLKLSCDLTHLGFLTKKPRHFVSHPRNIPPKFAFKWFSGFRGEYFF
jgi:hypothetical protein